MMKKFCFALSSIFILPHIVFYLLMKSKTGGVITMDIKRWLSIKSKDYNSFIGLIYLILRYPEFRSLFYHRIGKMRSLICKYLPGRTNLYFHTPSIFIGGGFYVGHGWGTVINASKIGENCGVGQNCTIGSRNRKSPILENGVMVWAHAVVLGDITIGENSQIGAGSVVVKNVPSNSVVVPSKSCIIRKDNQRCMIYL